MQETVPLEGFVLDPSGPDGGSRLAFRYGITQARDSSITLGRIKYRIGDDLFSQDLPFIFQARAREGTKPYLPPKQEEPCLEGADILND